MAVEQFPVNIHVVLDRVYSLDALLNERRKFISTVTVSSLSSFDEAESVQAAVVLRLIPAYLFRSTLQSFTEVIRVFLSCLRQSIHVHRIKILLFSLSNIK
jgi:hypothetical protein